MGRRQKARRGELHLTVAVGYVKTDDDRMNVLVPAIVQGCGKRPVEWKAPVYHTLHHMLTNPVYAGSYAYGRRGMSAIRR